MASNNILKTFTIGAIAVSAAIVTAHAGEAPDQRVVELKAAQQRLEWQARTTKPAAGFVLEREARRIEALIDALERGEKVDPAVLDRAVRRLR